MRTILKYAAAVTLTGALALAAATPSQARHGRNAALIGGLAAGAVIGAAAASANDGYYYGPGDYEPAPTYYYGPGPYAYEPAPSYYAPRYHYRYRSGSSNGSCGYDLGSSRC
jgi:hypothetical protein